MTTYGRMGPAFLARWSDLLGIMKRCSACDEWYPLDGEFWYRYSGGFWRSRCKACFCAQSNEARRVRRRSFGLRRAA